MEFVQLPVADLVGFAQGEKSVLLDGELRKGQGGGRAEWGVYISMVPEPEPRDLGFPVEGRAVVSDYVLVVNHRRNAAEHALQIGRVARSATALAHSGNQTLSAVIAVLDVQNIQGGRIDLRRGHPKASGSKQRCRGGPVRIGGEDWGVHRSLRGGRAHSVAG